MKNIYNKKVSLFIVFIACFLTCCDRNFNNIVDPLNPNRDSTNPTAPILQSPIDGSVTSSSTVTFEWSNSTDPDPTSTGIYNYCLQVSQSSSFTTYDINTEVSTTEYINTTALSDKTYYWKVCAYDNTGNKSDWSSIWDFNVVFNLATTPSNLTANTVSCYQISLGWLDNSSNEGGFKIERKIGIGGTYSQIVDIDENVTSYNDTGLSSNTQYYYRMYAYNVVGNSSFSNEDNATTLSYEEYDSPGSASSSLAWDGTNMWSCDGILNKIYKHNMDSTLSVANTYNGVGGAIVGLFGITWDGTNIWSCNANTSKIYKHNMDVNLSTVAVYNSPPLWGLAWDGTNIWSCDRGPNEIYKHNMDGTLSISNTYTSNDDPADLAWDGTNIWSSHFATPGKIHKHNMDGTLSISNTYNTPGYNPDGLVWDGTNIWSCGGSKIRKHVSW